MIISFLVSSLNSNLDNYQAALKYGLAKITVTGGYGTYDTGLGSVIIAHAYSASNAQACAAVAIQAGRYIRIYQPNGAYTSAEHTIEYYYV